MIIVITKIKTKTIKQFDKVPFLTMMFRKNHKIGSGQI